MKQLLQQLRTDVVTSKRGKTMPIIGISTNQKDGQSMVSYAYTNSVILGGGIPLMLPLTTDIEILTQMVDQLDGLLLTGGGDILPEYMGEEPIPQLGDVDPARDEYELKLFYLARERQIPILGICRGHQLINVAMGGKLYQDITTQHNQTPLKHSQKEPRHQPTHWVTIEPNTWLARLFPPRVMVNSIHHQSVSVLSDQLISCAVADDGINEAFVDKHYPIYGVQWHPEAMAVAGDKDMVSLFRFFVNKAHFFQQAKQFHREHIVLDSHCDTPMLFSKGETINQTMGRAKATLRNMRLGLVSTTVMAVYIPQGECTEQGRKAAFDLTCERLQLLRTQLNEAYDKAEQVYCSADVYRLKQQNKQSLFFGIENGYSLGVDLDNLDFFKRFGVIYITLCYNTNNDIGDREKGLTEFGVQVVRRMNQLGIMIDVSHASEMIFDDILRYSTQPVIASHSSCRALCDHRRNLTDNQIKALAEKGGVVQICLYNDFLVSDGAADVQDIIRHIDHIVQLVGVDYVGIGSDFDGGGGIDGCQSSKELINITTALIARGYNEESIRKIWGGNFLRVLDQVQKTTELCL